MDYDVIRKNLIYLREQTQIERGYDFSGCEALRRAIIRFTPEGYTVLDADDKCIHCNTLLCSEYKYCPNCGRIIF